MAALLGPDCRDSSSCILTFPFPSQTHVLSYSEPNLWRNGFLRRFGSFAWRRQRGSHLELSAHSPLGDPWLWGRLQRPAVGSDLDMRSRFETFPAGSPSGEQEGLELSSPPSAADSAEVSLASSTSFGSLLCWGEGGSGTGTFSLSTSSICPPTPSEPIKDTARHPSAQEETSRTPEPLLEWAERAFEEYLRTSCPTTTGGLSFGSSLGESASEQISGAAASPTVGCAPQATGAASAVPAPQDASKVCYAVVLTLTRAEEEDGQGGPAGSRGERGLPCHTAGEAALSLGVAEREKAVERRHQKPAQPAPQLPAHKECQNCRGLLLRVGTSQVRQQMPPPATGSLVTRQEGSEPRRGQSEEQSGSEQQHSRDGGLAGAPRTVGPESLASRYEGNRFEKSAHR